MQRNLLVERRFVDVRRSKRTSHTPQITLTKWIQATITLIDMEIAWHDSIVYVVLLLVTPLLHLNRKLYLHASVQKGSRGGTLSISAHWERFVLYGVQGPHPPYKALSY